MQDHVVTETDVQPSECSDASAIAANSDEADGDVPGAQHFAILERELVALMRRCAQSMAPQPPTAAPPADAIAAMVTTVKALQNRLTRLEKQHALPNSASEEPVTKTDDKASWPLDLNRPLDRGAVTPSLSFHADRI